MIIFISDDPTTTFYLPTHAVKWRIFLKGKEIFNAFDGEDNVDTPQLVFIGT